MKRSMLREGRNCWVSEGNAPSIGSYSNPSPDPRLGSCNLAPDKDSLAMFVIPMATIVSTNKNGFLVPCNSGKEVVLTKTALDAQYGSFKNLNGEVCVAGDTFVMEANQPIGWTIYDTLQNAKTLDENYNHQTDLSQTNPTLRMEGLIKVPFMFKTEGCKYDFKVGDQLVADGEPDKNENPAAEFGMARKRVLDTFDAGGLRTAVGDPEQMVAGRVVHIERDYEYNTGALELVKADGMDVSSDSSKGFEPYVWDLFKKTDDTYTKGIAWVKITL